MATVPTTFPLYPLNDLVLKAKLKEVVDGSVTATPLTTGTVTAFLATSNSPTATAAAGTSAGSCAHVSDGQWRIAFDAAALTFSVLDGLFGASPTACYCVIQQSGGFRTYVPLSYAPARPATLAA